MSTKLVLALALVGLCAACAQQTRTAVVPAATTVTPEPVFKGKYGAN